MEELGELCDEILAYNSRQRKEKIRKNKENLPEEFADVLIAVLVLARDMDTDVEKALKKKIKKINKRYEKV